MAAKLVFYSKREHYGVEDVRGTMTVGQMIEFLSDYDEDQEMVIAFDGGYTFGCILLINLKK